MFILSGIHQWQWRGTWQPAREQTLASQHPHPRLEIITSQLTQGSDCGEAVAVKFLEAEGIAYYSKAVGKTLAYLVLPTGEFFTKFPQ
jgi:hypothetical protein